MGDRHDTESTEVIRGEDWCTHCKKEVKEWKVSFEPTSEGYEKRRRCPHCDELCIEDSSFGLGCTFFFIGLYGAVIWSYLFEIGTGIFFAIMIAQGLALSFLSTWLWKHWLLRHWRKYKASRD